MTKRVFTFPFLNVFIGGVEDKSNGDEASFWLRCRFPTAALCFAKKHMRACLWNGADMLHELQS